MRRIAAFLFVLFLAACAPEGPKFTGSDVTGSSFGKDFALVDHTGKAPLLYQPGTVWEYGLSTDVLGLIVEARTPSTLHRELEAVVRPGDRYSLHVNALSHGRAVCRAGSPRCNECPVESQCAFRSAMTLPARTHATL